MHSKVPKIIKGQSSLNISIDMFLKYRIAPFPEYCGKIDPEQY